MKHCSYVPHKYLSKVLSDSAWKTEISASDFTIFDQFGLRQWVSEVTTYQNKDNKGKRRHDNLHKFMLNVINQMGFDSEKYTNIHWEFLKSEL